MFDDLDDDEKDMRSQILDHLMGSMRGGALQDLLGKKLDKLPDDAQVHVAEVKSGEVPADKLRDMLHAKIGESDDDADHDEDELSDMDRDEGEDDKDPDDDMDDDSAGIGMGGDKDPMDDLRSAMMKDKGMDDKEDKMSMAGSNPVMRKLMAARMKRKMG